MTDHAFYNKATVGDEALINKDSILRMKQIKGKIIELISEINGQVRGVKLNINQTKLKKTCYSVNHTIQLIVPFEIVNETPEPA